MNSMYIVLCVFLCLKISSSQKGSACINEITRETECCDNYILVDGICTECKNGTHKDGTMNMCLPCTTNMYGYKCFFHCNCNERSRCDPVIGCISITTFNTTEKTSTKRTTPLLTKPVQTNKTSVSIYEPDKDFSCINIVIILSCAVGLLSVAVLIYVILIWKYMLRTVCSYHSNIYEQSIHNDVTNRAGDHHYDVMNESYEFSDVLESTDLPNEY